MNDAELRELLERFLRWWLAFPGRPLRDLDDAEERNRRIGEGVDEFANLEQIRREREQAEG